MVDVVINDTVVVNTIFDEAVDAIIDEACCKHIFQMMWDFQLMDEVAAVACC